MQKSKSVYKNKLIILGSLVKDSDPHEEIDNLLSTKKENGMIDEGKVYLDVPLSERKIIVYKITWTEEIKINNHKYMVKTQAGQFYLNDVYYITFSFTIDLNSLSDMDKISKCETFFDKLGDILDGYNKIVHGNSAHRFFDNTEKNNFYKLYYINSSPAKVIKNYKIFVAGLLSMLLGDGNNKQINNNYVSDVVSKASTNIDTGMMFSAQDTTIVVFNNKKNFEERIGALMQTAFLAILLDFEISRISTGLQEEIQNAEKAIETYDNFKWNKGKDHASEKQSEENLYKIKIRLNNKFGETLFKFLNVLENSERYHGSPSTTYLYDFMSSKMKIKSSKKILDKFVEKLNSVILDVDKIINEIETEEERRLHQRNEMVYEISTIIALIISIISIMFTLHFI